MICFEFRYHHKLVDFVKVCVLNVYKQFTACLISCTFILQAYKKFIDKHMKEGKEYMKPPEPHMCVMTMTTVSSSLKRLKI